MSSSESTRFSSQRFDSVRFEPASNYAGENEPMTEGGIGDVDGDDETPFYGGGDAVAPASELTGDGPVLPILTEEGYALREWRRQNAIRLEEKEKREKELLKEIIDEADKYKEEFYKKWKVRTENGIAVNREKEKLFVENREKFHAEADKNYWKAISELIPKEIAIIEKKGKKEKEKQPSILVIQGPKPGKPTDLSRMRQILVKLKHKTPDHMMLAPAEPEKDAKTQ